MQRYIGAATLVLLVTIVLGRVLVMARSGTKAMKFGKTDKSDFLILPFVVFYFYRIFATTFRWPTVGSYDASLLDRVAWMGVVFCVAALILCVWSLVSFGTSFRVGIDTDNPNKLITTGVFAYSRNPIYVAFTAILFGEILIAPDWLLLLYLVAGVWLFNRQVMREEQFMGSHYGSEYVIYRQRVRRYI
ncbi:methyltransferase family protein [Candidatus Nitrosoglobus terrae]|uniref:methyltransferase family protein n=1 Tax=Candidatus Nitrosoglobus terrae TaxID=1630141 RepID=UPI000BBA58F2|nr:isoprenylcysteine carboxylmethyltransferase family protein [Candidatus Nitrosoglobus terrae]